tara:strand:- start:3130 stop:3744 length:615 start_codon:yes stop_codon:yes gene_type:complete
MSEINELNQKLQTETQNRIEENAGIRNREDQEFMNLEKRLMGRIKNLEQMINGTYVEEEYDLIKPYERDISSETRPQMSSSGLSQHNKHLSQLTNHELHQMKSLHEKDHKKPIKTIFDEPLGDILDKTLNFLVYSIDSYTEKIYESELMNKVNSTDKGYATRFKVHLMAVILFIREDENIIYIGLLLVFLSIIIYFINIITTSQ